MVVPEQRQWCRQYILGHSKSGTTIKENTCAAAQIATTQDLGQDRVEIIIGILNEDFFLIENLNEKLNAVLPKILIFDEALDEVLDF